MIKLTLPPKPSKLSEEEASLTEEFKNTGKDVWKKRYITKPLLQMSHDKCAYSEIKLGEESKYMQVEHFRHKSKYPEDVVNWNNLLPSCSTCNTTKGTHDVVASPIVNPIFDEPRVHLFVKAFRFYDRDQKGDTTIKKVALNDEDQFVIPRFKFAITTTERFEDKFDLLKSAADSGEKATRVLEIKKLLRKCGPHSAYSAVIATYLLYECPLLGRIRNYLETNGYWDQEFDDLYKVLESIALPE